MGSMLFKNKPKKFFKREEKGGKKSAEKERGQLHKKVGQLQIELDFLKKSWEK